MNDLPEFPAAYSPVSVDRPAAVVPHALALAAAGAEEGTLVWSDATDAMDASSSAIAVVLRPAGPLSDAGDVCLVSTVAAASALAGALPPMITLALAWPDSVVLNGRVAVQTRVHPGPVQDDVLDWLVVGIAFDALAMPPDDLGLLVLDPRDTVQRYARQLVLWLARWSDEGMSPVARMFEQRLANRDAPIRLRTGGAEITGVMQGVESTGEARLVGPGGPFRARAEDFLDAAAIAGR